MWRAQTNHPSLPACKRQVSQQHLSQLPYRCREVTLPPPHPKAYQRSPTATRKAVPKITLSIDPEARGGIVVERAQADGATGRRPQVNVLADEL